MDFLDSVYNRLSATSNLNDTRLSTHDSSLCSFLNPKERFSTPSGSMTDFILAPKARHRAKDTDMEEKEKRKNSMILMYTKISNEMGSGFFKSQ